MQSNKQNRDLVTVVTITYNAEKFLQETILSVVNQSYKNIEYIIIDGNSTDNTVNIIKKYEDKIDYWVSEPDEGIYYAMNKAIEKATGKWINFMNAGDTFFDLDTVKYVMEHKNDDTELIYGNVFLKEKGIVRRAWDQSQWYLQMPFCHQTLFTLTGIMKKEPFDISFRLAADHNFIVKMHKEKKKFDYIDKTLAIFALGGFANSNRFLMNIESLKVLLDCKIPQHEIQQSAWYKEFSRNACATDKNRITDLEKKLATQQGKYHKNLDAADKKLATLQEKHNKVNSKNILLENKLRKVYSSASYRLGHVLLHEKKTLLNPKVLLRKIKRTIKMGDKNIDTKV